MATDTEKNSTIYVNSKESQRAANFASLYTNSTLFAFTKYDVHMIFRRVITSSDPTQPEMEEVGTVSMSPEHAKALYNALGATLANYEKTHSVVIPEPKDAQQSTPKPVTKRLSSKK